MNTLILPGSEPLGPRKAVEERMPKFRPKCPSCGSILEKAYRGYSCPNPECKVIKVYFTKGRKVGRIVREGFDGIAFGRKKKKEGG